MIEHPGLHGDRAPSARQRAGSVDGDVSLLLRAHAELGWLRKEVLPVLLELEGAGPLTPAQRHAAHAYLEVVWAQAEARARQTDGTQAVLSQGGHSQTLAALACHYHAGVRELRARLAARISPLLTRADAPR